MFFDFFSKPSSLGISISDESISMIQLNLDGKLVAYSNTLLEDGTIRSGKIIDREKLADKLREAFTTAKPNAIQYDSKHLKVVFGLPETNVFLYAFRLPPDINGVDFVTYASTETATVVPFDPQDISWFYKRSEDKVLAVGVSREMLDSYTDVFRTIGLPSVAFDVDAMALGRALLHPHSHNDLIVENQPLMIVDIGVRSSFFVIYDSNRMVNLSVTTSVGGGEMDLVAKEIKAARAYYTSQFNESVAGIIVLGDFSYIPHADSFLAKETGLPVIHDGDPFVEIRDVDAVFGQIKSADTMADISRHLSYARAVGFALRNLPERRRQSEIDFGSI